MSDASTGASSLIEAKRARQQLEQDALLLANRIKLLQTEEARTRRRIEETKRKTGKLVQAQERKELEKRTRERVRAESKKNTEEARKRFYSLRAQRNTEKLKQRELLWISKKEAYTEGRTERDQAIELKRQIQLQAERANQERHRAVKGGIKLGNERLEKMKADQNRESHAQYVQRIEEEERKKAEKEKVVITMEMLEMELINKLKHTQMMEQEAMQQLEQAAKGRITC